MTRLKKLALGGAAAALIMTGAVSKSFAVESGAFQYLAGASIGIPGGAAAPPGLYTGFTSAYGIYGGMSGNQGGTLGVPGGGASTKGTNLGSFIGSVPLLWSTGWNFLGANYSMLVVQPFVTAYVGPVGQGSTTCAAGPAFPGAVAAGTSCAFQQMFINTVWQPLNMSWNLGSGWFASIAFTFQAPDGTRALGIANPDFWAFDPGVGISYLSANWAASVNMSYNIYTASGGRAMNWGGTAFGNGYVSGNQFVGDWYAAYKLGKWSFGPAGYWVWQTTGDRAGGLGCAAIAASGIGCGNENMIGFGALVGYDFGPVDLQVWATDTVWSQNAGQNGWIIWSRLSFRLWAPEAPKPLVAKN
jgi:hypothetical protein